MDRSNVITLVSFARTQDANGVWRDGTETTRDVFCQVDSVSRAEFFAGGQSGLKPEYRFTMFFGDYNGEKTVIYDGVRYSVYRTFHARTDDLELYVAKDVGDNKAKPTVAPVVVTDG